MRELLTQLTMVTVCVTVIWAWLQAPQQMADSLISTLTRGRVRHVGLRKPFGCELCMTFWLCLALCLLTLDLNLTNILLSLTLSLAFAVSVKYVLYTLTLIDALLSKTAEALERLINKI